MFCQLSTIETPRPHLRYYNVLFYIPLFLKIIGFGHQEFERYVVLVDLLNAFVFISLN